MSLAAPQPRPATHADPAWFATVPVLLPDGSLNPEYGCVFWSEAANGSVRYDYDTAGWAWCRTIPGGPLQGVVESQGRSFRIAGPSNDQILRALTATGDFRPFHAAYEATGAKLGDGWAYQVWLGAKWRAFEVQMGRAPGQPTEADRDAFLSFVGETAGAELVAA